jgi:hypothetical protein
MFGVHYLQDKSPRSMKLPLSIVYFIYSQLSSFSEALSSIFSPRTLHTMGVTYTDAYRMQLK